MADEPYVNLGVDMNSLDVSMIHDHIIEACKGDVKLGALVRIYITESVCGGRGFKATAHGEHGTRTFQFKRADPMLIPVN